MSKTLNYLAPKEAMLSAIKRKTVTTVDIRQNMIGTSLKGLIKFETKRKTFRASLYYIAQKDTFATTLYYKHKGKRDLPAIAADYSGDTAFYEILNLIKETLNDPSFDIGYSKRDQASLDSEL